jgi:hypothetical protein
MKVSLSSRCSWKGKPLDKCSRDELLEVIEWLSNQCERLASPQHLAFWARGKAISFCAKAFAEQPGGAGMRIAGRTMAVVDEVFPEPT